MMTENKKGYIATYVGALIPIAAVTVLIIPLAIYTHLHSAQLELGGFLFVAVEAVLVICGLLLIPVGIYFALKRRGYQGAGSTVKYIILMTVALYLFSIAVQYPLQDLVSKKSAATISATVFYIVLLFLPCLARRLAIRDITKNRTSSFDSNRSITRY